MLKIARKSLGASQKENDEARARYMLFLSTCIGLKKKTLQNEYKSETNFWLPQL